MWWRKWLIMATVWTHKKHCQTDRSERKIVLPSDKRYNRQQKLAKYDFDPEKLSQRSDDKSGSTVLHLLPMYDFRVSTYETHVCQWVKSTGRSERTSTITVAACVTASDSARVRDPDVPVPDPQRWCHQSRQRDVRYGSTRRCSSARPFGRRWQQFDRIPNRQRVTSAFRSFNLRTPVPVRLVRRVLARPSSHRRWPPLHPSTVSIFDLLTSTFVLSFRTSPSLFREASFNSNLFSSGLHLRLTTNGFFVRYYLSF